MGKEKGNAFLAKQGIKIDPDPTRISLADEQTLQPAPEEGSAERPLSADTPIEVDAEGNVRTVAEPPTVPASETSKANLRGIGIQEVNKLAKEMGLIDANTKPKDKTLTKMVDGLLGGEFGKALEKANLAIPSDKQAIRDFATDFLIERQANLDVRKNEVAQQDAATKIEAQGGIEASLERLAGGEIIEGDTGVHMVKQILSDKAVADRFAAGDIDTIAKVQDALKAHYDRGTDIGREMQARRDTTQTPEGRRSFLIKAMLGGSTKGLSEKQLAKRAVRAQAIVNDLKAEGIDISKIPDKALMDDNKHFDLLSKIGAATSTPREKFMEWRRNALLSAPKTHEVNVIGNTARGAHELVGQRALEIGVARLTGATGRVKREMARAKAKTSKKLAGIDKELAKRGGEIEEHADLGARRDRVLREAKTQRDSLANDLPATYKGTIAAHKAMAGAQARAALMAKDAMIHDMPVSKGDTGVDPSSFAAIGGVKGKAIRTPQRALNAMDIYASEILRSGLAADFATREAQAMGIKSIDGITKFVEQATKDPQSRSNLKAEKESLRLTFRDEPGKFAKMILKWRNTPGTFGVIGELMFPFVTTPASLVKQGVRATPLGSVGLLSKVIEDSKKGKGISRSLTDDEGIKRLSEQVIGWTATVALAHMVENKDEFGRPRITGSMPADATPEERDFLYRNQPPQSIRIGNQWVSYARIEPLATTLTTTIDMLKAAKTGVGFAKGEQSAEKFSNEVTKAITSPFRDKTYMKALGELLEAASGDEGTKGLPDIVSNQITSLMPNIIKSGFRAKQDEFQERRSRSKTSEGPAGALRARGKQSATQLIPTRSSFTTNVRIDHWGDPIKRQSSPISFVPDVMWRMLSPVEVQSTGVQTPIDMAILSWNDKAEKGDEYWPTRLNDKKVRGDDNSTMTDDEFEQFARTRGEIAKEFFAEDGFTVDDPTNPTSREIDIIKKLFSKAGRIARNELFGIEAREIRLDTRARKLEGAL